MLSLHRRLALVVEDIWRRLPALKSAACIRTIAIAPELGALHGQFSPASGTITIHPRLLNGDGPQFLPLIDIHGNDPPVVFPCISRVYHTLTHEMFHAILSATGADKHPAWLALSGWVEDPEDVLGTARYWERRPGWPQGPSAWRYTREGVFFVRPYSSSSPYEDAADLCTHMLLGWTDGLTSRNGQAKIRWLRRQVFGETGARHIQASRDRWRVQMQGVRETAMPARDRVKRWRDVAEAALLVGMTRLLWRWHQRWQAQVTQGDAWSPITEMASDVVATIRPPLQRLFGQIWQQQTREAVPRDLLQHQQVQMTRAATAFSATTHERLLRHVTPLRGQATRRVQDALTHVQHDALQIRTPLLAQTEMHRTAQAAARGAALLEGATQATWRTTSGTPCDFCRDLEGQTFPLEGVLFEQGAVVTSGNGTRMTVAYEAVRHPPLHPQCHCVLDYT